jgi:hypothetical protein
MCQISDESGLAIASGDVQYVTLCHAPPAETTRVLVIRHFQHTTMNIRSVLGEEAFDVITVNALSTVEPEDAADRFQAAQMAEVYFSQRRHCH